MKWKNLFKRKIELNFFVSCKKIMPLKKGEKLLFQFSPDTTPTVIKSFLKAWNSKEKVYATNNSIFTINVLEQKQIKVEQVVIDGLIVPVPPKIKKRRKKK